MKQIKRLFYMVLLNVIISAITVGVVLQLWQKDHPAITAEQTPKIIIVEQTQSVILPLVGNAASAAEGALALQAGTETIQVTPTLGMVTYQIKEGDTLGALAIQFNTTVADIMTVNNLTDADNLTVGQIITIPTGPLPKITATAVPATGIPSPTPRLTSTPTQKPLNTATPTLTGQQAQVMIDTVIGAGALETERVVLKRTGDGELSLVGWRLTNSKGMEYYFPQITLYKGTSINLNTRTGQDTVSDLYWGLTTSIWKSGEVVSLYDSQNNLRATYTIP